jgi:hypothetical protein
LKSFIPKAAGVALATMSAMSFIGVGTASAATSDGTASLVTGSNSSTTPLTSGNSDTLYGVNLQASAQAANGTVNNRPDCSADSATGSTNVFIYLVHQGEDPTKLNMSTGEPGTLPDSSTTLTMFDSNGTVETSGTGPYGNTQNTAAGTGQINLPPTQQFQWGQVTATSGGGVPLTGSTGLLYQGTTGTWHGGYVCYKAGSGVTDWWGFTITFTQNSASGGSQGFTWTVTPDQPPSSTPEVPLPILLPLGGAGLIAGGVLFSRRRSHGTTAA